MAISRRLSSTFCSQFPGLGRQAKFVGTVKGGQVMRDRGINDVVSRFDLAHSFDGPSRSTGERLSRYSIIPAKLRQFSSCHFRLRDAGPVITTSRRS
jgi:hypothetical protein